MGEGGPGGLRVASSTQVGHLITFQRAASKTIPGLIKNSTVPVEFNIKRNLRTWELWHTPIMPAT